MFGIIQNTQINRHQTTMEVDPLVDVPKFLVSFKKQSYLDARVSGIIFLFVVKNLMESRPTAKIYSKSSSDVIHVGVINVPYIHIDPIGFLIH